MTQQHDDHGHDDHDHDVHDHADHEHAFEWPEMVRIALVGLAAAMVWFRVWEPVSNFSIVGVAGLLVGGWPIFKEAFENLIAKRMTMELSMSIAIVAAAAISEFFTALVITLFVLVAEVLEGMTVSRGRRAIRDLLDFLPRAVSVRRAGGIAEVDADALSPGDAVLVNPGGRIPVDGIVIAGHSFVDQARITGESMPLEKFVGASVFAGSINQSGALEIRAERIGRDTSYGKIIEAVEQAERSRAPVAALGRSVGRIPGLLRAGSGGIDLPIDPRQSLDDIGHHRGRRMRYCGGHAAGNSWRHRPRCPRRSHRQGRVVSRTAWQSEHRGSGQDRHPYLRTAGGARASSCRRCR